MRASSGASGSFAAATRSINDADTRRCCAPSWRSRSSRWRVSSAVRTMRARDSRSSASARSFAIDCAARSAKLRRRTSAPAGNGCVGRPRCGQRPQELRPDDHGRADRRAGAALTRELVGAAGEARLEHLQRGASDGGVVERARRRRLRLLVAPAVDDHDLVLDALPAHEHHARRAEERSDLRRHLGHDLRRRLAPRHEGRDSPERGLLGHELRRVPPRLDVDDRLRHERREVAQLVLRPGRKGVPRLGSSSRDDTPDLPVDLDRRTDRRLEPELVPARPPEGGRGGRPSSRSAPVPPPRRRAPRSCRRRRRTPAPAPRACPCRRPTRRSPRGSRRPNASRSRSARGTASRART